MARPGAFKSEKRKKELMRQKKQEMKRQRRLGKDTPTEERDVTSEVTTGVTDEGEEETGKNDEEKE